MGILIAFAIMNVFSANKKGYNPFIWFFSSCLIGNIVLSTLPSVKEEKNSELQIKLKKRGDKIGLITAGVTVVLGVILNIALTN